MPRIKSILIQGLSPFSRYEIVDIPKEARLVVMLGPNGCGKTSVLQAVNVAAQHLDKGVRIECHDYPYDSQLQLYLRTAYRAMSMFNVTPEQISQAMSIMPPMPGLPRNAAHSTAFAYHNFLALIGSSANLALTSEKTWEQAAESVMLPLQERLSALFPNLKLMPVSRKPNH
jgi:energy-coupling factor transporter ATP-binding protein EcfA2